jgi:hypothetical protein
VEKRELYEVTEMLVDLAYKIIEYRGKLAFGVTSEDLPENYVNFNIVSQNYIMDLVKPLLGTAQQTKKIQAETVKDVIKQLGSGKVSLDEAKKLIELITAKAEAEMLEDIYKK